MTNLETIREKAHRVVEQRKQVKGPTPLVTCGCGFMLPLRFTYKCLFCSEWFCHDCAKVHFMYDENEEWW